MNWLTWRNWCDTVDNGPMRLRMRLLQDPHSSIAVPVVNPDGKPLEGTSRCDAPDAPSVLQAGPFERV